MSSKVYFSDLRVTDSRSLLIKLRTLAEKAGLGKVVKKRGLTALKIHFGERGNTAFIRPLFVRPLVDAVRDLGGSPFLTDANTLYVGSRGNAVDHLNTAILNGFAHSVVNAPLVIADGLDGRDEVTVPINLKNCREAHVGSAVARADALLSIAHFKLHEASGFGGAIKNLGMGSASRRGKMAQHSEMEPEVMAKKCVGCGICRDQCAHGAITIVDRPNDMPRPRPDVKKIVHINRDKCVGCAGCLHACPEKALDIHWEKDLPKFMERMVEYTVATVKGKEKRLLCINFLTQISPACDCHSYADAPIVADIGILASRDPVAVDQASMDLLNAQPHLKSSCIGGDVHTPMDKVRAVYPQIDWRHQLIYAEEIGLGSRAYELIPV